MYKLIKNAKKVMIYLILIIASFVSIFPCYWMFIGATNTSKDVAGGRLIIGNYLMENMNKLFSKYPVRYALINSIKIAVITVVGSLLVTSLAAYGFEKFTTKMSNKVYNLFLLGMMIPPAILVIPLFRIMASMNLVNNHFAVILPAIPSIFLIFFFRQNFKSLPDSILESARIDGANELMIFFRIVVPSMKNVYAAAAIYAFMTSWNNYMWPLIALQSEKNKTLTLIVSSINSSTYVADYGVQMAGLAIATLPMLIVFLVMQRSFVEGMTGSVKG